MMLRISSAHNKDETHCQKLSFSYADGNWDTNELAESDVENAVGIRTRNPFFSIIVQLHLMLQCTLLYLYM